MSPTRLGVMALKDPAFVFQLRKGRKVRASTAAAVEAWMTEYARTLTLDRLRAEKFENGRVLLVHPTMEAPAALHVYGDGDDKPTVIPLTPSRALTLAGDLVQAAHALLATGADLKGARA